MANSETIEELIIKLGIDADGVESGGRRADNTFDRTRAKALGSSKSINDSAQASISFFKRLATSAATFMGVLFGARGMTDFIAGMTKTGAEAGLFSKNMGIATEDVQKWQGASRMFGGSADGMANTLANLTKEQQSYITTGESGILPYLRALGVGFDSADNMLLDLAKSVEGMDRVQANAVLGNIGIDQGTINLLLEGSDKVQLLLNKQKALNLITKESAERALKLRQQWETLKQRGESLGRDVFGAMIPYIEKATTKFTEVSDWAKAHGEFVANTFKVIGAAITVALIPAFAALLSSPFALAATGIIAVGTAISGLYDDYKVWRDGGSSLINWDNWQREIDLATNGINYIKSTIKEFTDYFDGDYKAKTRELIDKAGWGGALKDAERIFKALTKLNQDYGFSIDALKTDWDEFKKFLGQLADWKPFGDWFGGKTLGELFSGAFDTATGAVKEGIKDTADLLESETLRSGEQVKESEQKDQANPYRRLNKSEQEEFNLVKKPSQYDDIFERVEKKYNLPKNMLKLTAAGESRMNPKAISPANKDGARDYGLMQHNSKYLAERGLTPTSALDPEQSIEASGKLFRSLIDRNNGDTRLAFKRYNGSGTRAENYANTRMNVMGALNDKAAIPEGLKLKSQEAIAGGAAHQGTYDLAKKVQDQHGDDIKYFSAFNDSYHKAHSPESGHTKGLKFDVVLKDPKKANEVKKGIEAIAKEHGVAVKVLNEYANLSEKGTGGHLDVGFKTKADAEKFQLASNAMTGPNQPLQKQSPSTPLQTVQNITQGGSQVGNTVYNQQQHRQSNVKSDVHIGAINVKTDGQTPGKVWQDMGQAIKQNPLIQANGAIV